MGKLNDQQRLAIAHRYQAGESSSQLSKVYGIAPQNIVIVLERLGIPRRDRSTCQRHHTANDAFFDQIKSEAPAYWFGFLAADGTLSSQGHAITLILQARDVGHLEKFRCAIEATNPIKQYRHEGCDRVSIHVCSRPMHQSLVAKGLSSGKAETLEWPDLPDTLLRHFLRGYVDGDGCFGYYHRRGFFFNLHGNRPFLLAAQTFLMDNCRLQRTKLAGPTCALDLYKLQYGGNLQVPRIGMFLYEDSMVFLDRKKELIYGD